MDNFKDGITFHAELVFFLYFFFPKERPMDKYNVCAAQQLPLKEPTRQRAVTSYTVSFLLEISMRVFFFSLYFIFFLLSPCYILSSAGLFSFYVHQVFACGGRSQSNGHFFQY